MPIFEYACHGCGEEFEAWVRKSGEAVECPECGDTELEKLLSSPRVHSEGRRDRSMRAAKRRDSSQAKEMAHAQRQYELAHDD